MLSLNIAITLKLLAKAFLVYSLMDTLRLFIETLDLLKVKNLIIIIIVFQE